MWKRFSAGFLIALMTHWCFAQSYAAGQCQFVEGSETCVDSTPCKTDSKGNTVCLASASAPAGAMKLSQTCWQYSYQYNCSSTGTNNCTEYQNNSACTMIKANCLAKDATGTCITFDYQYQCQTGEGTTSPIVACSNGLFDTSSFTTPTVVNTTFPTAAIATETMREVEVYNQDQTQIFMGVKETCENGLVGIKHCCSTASGAMSNADVSHQITTAAFSSAVKYVAQPVINWASAYVYDAMFDVGVWASEISTTVGGNMVATAMAEQQAASVAAQFGNSYSLMGFTYQSQGTFAAAQSAGVVSQNSIMVTQMGSAEAPSGFIAFNPYVFAAMVVIMVVMEMAKCTSEEQMLAMHRGASLSYFIKSECTERILGSCQMEEQTYCSFNSVLAKIINIQGKQQLGLDISDCAGLTLAQIQQLDFTKIDFSAFATSISKQVATTVPTSSAISSAYTGVINATTKTSTQTTGNLVYPSYPVTGP